MTGDPVHRPHRQRMIARRERSGSRRIAPARKPARSRARSSAGFPGSAWHDPAARQASSATPLIDRSPWSLTSKPSPSSRVTRPAVRSAAGPISGPRCDCSNLDGSAKQRNSFRHLRCSHVWGSAGHNRRWPLLHTPALKEPLVGGVLLDVGGVALLGGILRVTFLRRGIARGIAVGGFRSPCCFDSPEGLAAYDRSMAGFPAVRRPPWG